MTYKKKEYKSSKSQEEKRKKIDLLIKQADEKIDKIFNSPNDLKEYLSFMAKFHNYSYRNSILIEEQFDGAVAVGSFAFWKDKGYSVNKGEKGIKILVPVKLGDRFIAEDGTKKLVSKASEREKNLIKNGELEVIKGNMRFNQGYVFDVSQTNMPASELPKIFPNKWLEGDVKNYKAFYKSLEDVASKIDVKIIEPKSELGLVKGVSYTSTREVALNPRNSELQNIKTLIHELAHAKLHTVETRDNYTKAEKEFQAEMVALSVSSYFGINTEEYSLRYLSEWTKNATFKDKEKLLKEVSTTVKEYVEIMEDSLNTERELTKENELVNSLSDKNIKNESELNLEIINKLEKLFNIEYSNKSEIEINTNEILNSDMEKMELLKDRINNEYRLGIDQSKDCRIDYGILKTFSERFNEKLEVLDKLRINHVGIEKVDKEEIVKYSEKARFPEVGEVKIFKSESMHFKENQILDFNEANSLFEREEAHIRDLKKEYEKKGEYYPYEKVNGEVKINDNVDFEFRYDIGDGEFYNLADLLERQLSNTNHQYAVKDFLIEKGGRENEKEEKGINDLVSNLNYEKEEELER